MYVQHRACLSHTPTPPTTSSHIQTVKKSCDRIVIRSCASMQMPKLCSTCQ